MSGVASCRCVRPTFTMLAHCFALPSSASRSCSTAGSIVTMASAAAMCIAVGNVSLDDCDMFT